MANSGMLSRAQLLQLFDDFSALISTPEVKRRIADAVNNKQEAVAVTTEIQEELLEKMGIDPMYGIACLGRVNSVFKDDRELMLRFYAFVTKEELACHEAELGTYVFNQKMKQFEKIQEQQLEVLRQLRNFPVKEQQLFLDKLRDHMQHSEHDHGSSIMGYSEIEEFFQQHQRLFT